MLPIQPPSDVWHTSGWCAGPCSSLALHSVTPINHWPPEPAPHTWPASLDLWPLYIQAHPFTTTESSPHNSLYKNISAETLRRHGTHCCGSPSFSDTVLSYSYQCRVTCYRHTRAVFCLLLGVGSGCAWPIIMQVTSVTWPVIGWA